jgi:histidinol-phosphatase
MAGALADRADLPTDAATRPISGAFTNMHAEELRFARELAELGGRIAMGHYRRDPESKKKDDGTWVTEADWAVEAQIRLRIARTFPEHNVLGEEEGLTAAGGGAPREGAPTWVIDPIDGTNNYMAGIPVWATLVGLAVEGRAVVGVAHAPALEETYDAAAGLGARMNGDAISVDRVDDLSRATVLYASISSFLDAGLGAPFEALAERSYRTRGFGDFWGHMLVARGAAHAMIEPELRTWDFLPLEVIVAEAGGRQSTLQGDPPRDHGSVVTTNGSLHDDVLAVFRGRG